MIFIREQYMEWNSVMVIVKYILIWESYISKRHNWIENLYAYIHICRRKWCKVTIVEVWWISLINSSWWTISRMKWNVYCLHIDNIMNYYLYVNVIYNWMYCPYKDNITYYNLEDVIILNLGFRWFFLIREQ